MAKKKVTHQPKDPKQEAPQAQHPDHGANRVSEATPAATIRMAAMDDSSDKLQSLKSLNSRLLKETYERRQQMDSLVQAKEALEAELNRKSQEKKGLETELTRASEKSVGLELEKGVLRVFVETQMAQMGVGFDGWEREKKVEIERVRSEKEVEIVSLKWEVSKLMGSLENERDKVSRVCRERDDLRKDFEGLVMEANGLKEKVVESEKRERLVKEEVEKLKGEFKGLMEVRVERERALEALKKEKVLAERKLVESEKLTGDTRSKTEQIAREKNEILRENSELEVQIGVLEKEVGQKNEVVLDLRREVELLRTKILESDKFIEENMKEMEMEIKSLKEEKEENQQNIEKFRLKSYEVGVALKVANMEINDKEIRIEELVRTKNEIEEVNVGQESEILKLHNEVGELRDALFALRTSCRDEEEKNKQLLSEVSNHNDALDRATLQKEEAQRGFDEERKNVENLKLVISEGERRIEEIIKESQILRGEHEKLLDKTKATESRLESLVKERDTAQKSLLEVQSRMEEWKAKVESAGINSQRALAMLKKTAAMVSSQSEQCADGKKEVLIHERKLEEEVQPYVAELEAIHTAFKSKEKMVEDMKQQVEDLKRSAAEARKQKSFWTLITSATTIFAAASVAYAAKGR
ncbi:DNA repair protein XRCC4, C-terminal [Parasponia andersonii]|uniref:DNA repair protein XRCC4, C-terminal n=1 Tax=Parasponia andersonii TaxID=3476 RepID=A0A2P5DI48_PARAD|nr:DNA repair protein XRCC4, C-terminal [Parasponia andersonii]